MNKILLLALTTIAPAVSAQTVYINETFDVSETIGNAPTDPAQRRSSVSTVQAGAGVIGTDNVARYADGSAATSGALEYSVGPTAVDNLYIRFEVLNNGAAGATGSFIFGVGLVNDGTGSTLTGAAARAVAVDFGSASGAVNIRSNATSFASGTYTSSALQTVKIWVNDKDDATVSYVRPDTSALATLNANSAVVWINNALVGGATESGISMSSVAGTVSASPTLGRFGFNSVSSAIADFSIDNLLVTSIPVAIPEPAASAALAGAGLLGLAALRRRRA